LTPFFSYIWHVFHLVYIKCFLIIWHTSIKLSTSCHMDNDPTLNQLTCVITILGLNFISIKVPSGFHFKSSSNKFHPKQIHLIRHPKFSSILAYFSFNYFICVSSNYFINISSVFSSTFYFNFSSMLQFFFIHISFVIFIHDSC